MSLRDIEISHYDFDDLTDRQRFQMCDRVMKTVPELRFTLLEDAKIGKSKYYAVLTMTERLTEDPKPHRHYLRAFKCPSQPAVYTHFDELGRGLFAIIQRSETQQNIQPAFDIMGYEIRWVKSIEVCASKSRDTRNLL